MLNITPKALAFGSTSAVLNQLFLGKVTHFTRKIPSRLHLDLVRKQRQVQPGHLYPKTPLLSDLTSGRKAGSSCLWVAGEGEGSGAGAKPGAEARPPPHKEKPPFLGTEGEAGPSLLAACSAHSVVLGFTLRSCGKAQSCCFRGPCQGKQSPFSTGVWH